MRGLFDSNSLEIHVAIVPATSARLRCPRADQGSGTAVKLAQRRSGSCACLRKFERMNH